MRSIWECVGVVCFYCEGVLRLFFFTEGGLVWRSVQFLLRTSGVFSATTSLVAYQVVSGAESNLLFNLKRIVITSFGNLLDMVVTDTE